MPPVVAAIGAAVASAGGIAGIAGSLFTNLITSLVLSGLQKLIAPKPPKNSGQSLTQNSGITQQVRQPVITRKPVYGEIRRSGGLIFMGVSDTNKYLHMIIELSPHEVSEIGEVWLNDYSIPPDALDANGNVISGRYEGIIRIRKHLGTASQTADTYLMAECPQWTANHRLRGIAYIYVRLKWDQDKFPSGLPNISAWVKGKKVYDPRTTLTAYSENPALILNDYLQDPIFGLGAASSEVDETYVIAAANVCDEFVTVTNNLTVISSVDTSTSIITLVPATSTTRLFLQRADKVQLTTTGTLPTGLSTLTDYYVIPYERKTTLRVKLAATHADALSGNAVSISGAGTGTHTIVKQSEPRYAGSLVIDTEQDVGENCKEILGGMLGDLTYTGGVYKVMAGAYQTPVYSFDEGNIVSSINIVTKISMRERFNTVRGVYVSQLNDGEPTDYPQITNAAYIADDLETIVKQIDMTMTQRPHMAQRIAKVALELSRQEITWSADFDLSALRVIAGDNAYFTIEKFGWSNKVFRIKDWHFAVRDDGEASRPVVRMTLREIASANYDWNSGEETSIDPAPDTTLPDPFTVAAVIGLGISSEAVETSAGDSTFKILMTWNTSNDEFVYNGGFYEIEYKKSTADTYRPTYRIDGNFSFAEVTLAAELNTEYDIRIRAVNSLGVRSAYSSILNYLVGTSGGVGSTEDWGTFVESPSSSEDWGDFTTSPPTTTEDWGYFT